MRRFFAALFALAVAAAVLLYLPRLSGIRPAPRPERDPLSVLGAPRVRPLTPAQLAALARYDRADPDRSASSPSSSAVAFEPARSPATGLERRFVLQGEPLRYSPEPGAAVIGAIEASALVPVVSERDGWSLIRSGERTGWIATGRLVRLGEPAGEGSPPLGSDPTPTLPLPATPADPERLARARAHLDLVRTRTGRLGPWALLTDVEDGAVLDRLGQVASRLERAYRERYGLVPVGEARETIVLFADEAAYRAYRRAEGVAAGERVAGHAGAGLAVLALGARGPEATAESLVHELTHLLNRRAIGPALPPWLDEGLANDLALCRTAPDGTLQLGTLSVRRRPRSTNEVEIDGGEAMALVARRRLGSLVPLERLLELDLPQFLRPAESELHYAESLLFIRYLLDGGTGGAQAVHREAFLGFLRAVSQGAPIDTEAFRAHLGPSWERLQAGFETWLGFSIQP